VGKGLRRSPQALRASAPKLFGFGAIAIRRE
jgi:hypothetical protein